MTDGSLFSGITLGEVVSADDPLQMGRLQVYVPSLDFDKEQELPWAMYASPFAGVSGGIARGTQELNSNGQVAYGLWAIPKQGANVLIMCIDQNPDQRIWMGCVHGFHMAHTLPHGRYIENDGPLSSSEEPIVPTYTNQISSFSSAISGVKAKESFEYKTRGADKQASSVKDEWLGRRVEYSKKPDDNERSETEADGNEYTITQGYQATKIDGAEGFDSSVYSITSPGFHSIALNDDPKNCRIRLRTTSGNQIIFDDTNERIYISTAKGKSWIEMDEAGTLDVFSEQDISLRSKQDINITSDKSVRIAGRQGVHIASNDQIRLHSGSEIHVKSDFALNVMAADSASLETGSDLNMVIGGDIKASSSELKLEASGSVHLKGSSIQAGSSLSLLGTMQVVGPLAVAGPIAAGGDVTTPTGSLNNHTHTYVLPESPAKQQPGMTSNSISSGGSAPSVSASPSSAGASSASIKHSYFPSRVPQHEPYARVYLEKMLTDSDDDSALQLFDGIKYDPSSVSEYDYNSPDVGKGSAARGRTVDRNPNWHR